MPESAPRVGAGVGADTNKTIELVVCIYLNVVGTGVGNNPLSDWQIKRIVPSNCTLASPEVGADFST